MKAKNVKITTSTESAERDSGFQKGHDNDWVGSSLENELGVTVIFLHWWLKVAYFETRDKDVIFKIK